MNNFFYSIQSFFEWTFSLMKPTGDAINLFFILTITVLTFYWIREMYRNPDKKKA